MRLLNGYSLRHIALEIYQCRGGIYFIHHFVDWSISLSSLYDQTGFGLSQCEQLQRPGTAKLMMVLSGAEE